MNRKSLELNSDVDFLVEMEKESSDRSVSIEEFHAVSEKAYCSENIGRIKFLGNARLESDSQLHAGDTIEIAVDPDLREISSLTSIGNASYRSTTSGESQVLSGDRIHFRIHPVNRNLEVIFVSGHAVLDFISPSEEMSLQGAEIDLYLDPERNRPLRIEAGPGLHSG